MQLVTEPIETSHQLFQIVEDGHVFDPVHKVNQMQGSFMSIDYEEDTFDGVFERVSDWTRFINRVDNEGASAFLTWLGNSKLKFDLGYCTVEREGKFSDKGALVFKEPIKVVVSHLNNNPIVVEVDRIEGEFTYEWGWLKKGRQDKQANTVELWFDCQKYINTKLEEKSSVCTAD